MTNNTRKSSLGEMQNSLEKKVLRCFIAIGFPLGMLFLWIYNLLVIHDFTMGTVLSLTVATVVMCLVLYLWFFVPLSSYRKDMNLTEVFSPPKVIVNDEGLHLIRKKSKETIKFNEISEIFWNPNLNYFVIFVHPTQKNKKNYILIAKNKELERQQIKEKLSKKCNVNFEIDMCYDTLKKRINTI